MARPRGDIDQSRRGKVTLLSLIAHDVTMGQLSQFIYGMYCGVSRGKFLDIMDAGYGDAFYHSMHKLKHLGGMSATAELLVIIIMNSYEQFRWQLKTFSSEHGAPCNCFDTLAPYKSHYLLTYLLTYCRKSREADGPAVNETAEASQAAESSSDDEPIRAPTELLVEVNWSFHRRSSLV